jgi:hypothetical protein
MGKLNAVLTDDPGLQAAMGSSLLDAGQAAESEDERGDPAAVERDGEDERKRTSARWRKLVKQGGECGGLRHQSGLTGVGRCGLRGLFSI